MEPEPGLKNTLTRGARASPMQPLNDTEHQNVQIDCTSLHWPFANLIVPKCRQPRVNYEI